MLDVPIPYTLISIHALREEGDTRCSSVADRYTRFLSTPSARRATDWQVAAHWE